MRDPHERPTLRLALVLNASMAVAGLAAGWWAHSSGLLADALDMGVDAVAYALALAAFERGDRFKARAASMSGGLLVLLGIGLLVDVGRRALGQDAPVGPAMMAVATVSLIVNTVVLARLARYRQGEVHLRATWLFTRVDVLANLGVIVSGGLVALLHTRWPDLVIGGLIGGYVLHEAWEILRSARAAADLAQS